MADSGGARPVRIHNLVTPPLDPAGAASTQDIPYGPKESY